MADQEENQQRLTPQEIEKIAHEQAEKGRRFGSEGSADTYSNRGPKGDIDDDTITNEQDPLADDAVDRQEYGYQDQFGDVDGQDPYNNLDESTIDDTSEDEEEGLYGLAEPLAQAGDRSRKGSDKDRYGTERSQDQQGYQQ